MLSLILTLSNASFIGCMPFRGSSGAKEDTDRTFWAEAKGLTPAVTRDNIRQTIQYIETNWTGLEVVELVLVLVVEHVLLPASAQDMFCVLLVTIHLFSQTVIFILFIGCAAARL
jgi:hypothetical protein